MSTEDDTRELSALLREHATRHRADDALRASIRARLAREAAPAPAAPRGRPRWAWGLGGLGLGSLATAALMATLLLPMQREAALQQELVGSHVRALMPGHLADVASSERHTVKPWFQGRLDYSPPVDDPAPETPLVGGRLDVVGGRPVAALVYRRNGHLIDHYVWPGERPDGLQRTQLRGFHLVHWGDGSMQHWLVSDLNADELEAFARRLRNGR